MSKVSQFIWAKIVGGGAVPFSCLKVGEMFRWPDEESGNIWPKTKLRSGQYRVMILNLKRGSQERTCRCRQGTAVIPIKD